MSPIYHKAHKPSLIYQSCTHTPIKKGSGYLFEANNCYHSEDGSVLNGPNIKTLH